MRVERKWAMPNKWTFQIKPIKELLEEEVTGGLWCDPFAGSSKLAQVRNDIAFGGVDAIEFLESRKDSEFDGLLLDPPYSKRQVSEHYKKAGIKPTGWHTSSGWESTIKDEVSRVVKIGGKVITFGWNSVGVSKSRGFKLERVLLVCHGGGHNDTIVTVETKLLEGIEE